MTLYVETDGLTAMEGMVQRAADDVIAARNHFEENGKILWVLDGIINIVEDDSNRIRWSVLAFLNKVGQNALPAAAEAITDARNYYARTDQASAEKIDATMPGVNVAAQSKDVPAPQPGPGNRDMTPLHDVREPGGRLGQVPFDDSAYGMDYQPKWHEMISPHPRSAPRSTKSPRSPRRSACATGHTIRTRSFSSRSVATGPGWPVSGTCLISWSGAFETWRSIWRGRPRAPDRCGWATPATPPPDTCSSGEGPRHLGENSRYRALLHDDELRRRLVVEMLAESDDPMLREMGEQLRDGVVTPSQLMSIPEYWEALSGGYEALGRIDLDQVAEQVDAADDAPSDDASAAPGPLWDEYLRRDPPTSGEERERGR